jgi:hypothetical protein
MVRGRNENVFLKIQECTMGLEVVVIFPRFTKDVAIYKQALSGCYLYLE